MLSVATTVKLFLACGLFLTGTLNTLLVQAANVMESMGNDGSIRKFNHPYLQAWGMFLAELGCMCIFLVDRSRRSAKRQSEDALGLASTKDNVLDCQQFNPLIFILPAALDLTATCVVYVSLTLTRAGSYQMLRGSVIVFTSFFARFLLRKHIKYIQWFGITIVIAGVLTVGITDIMYIKQTTANDAILNPTLSENHTTHDLPTLNDILLGDLLVIGAQILVAAQITYEEKVVTKYDIPILHVLGLEGFFGTGLMSVLLIVMYFIPVGPKFGQGNPHHVMEDALDGMCQLRNKPALCITFVATTLSISTYYFIALNITKTMGSTTRVVIDSMRTLCLWGISIALGWAEFNVFHLIGFTLLIIGNFIYNEIIIVPGLKLAWYLFKRLTGLNAASYDLQKQFFTPAIAEPNKGHYQPKNPDAIS